MADGDAQFRVGVQHGFDDEPVYRWRDPFHQERYDAGYAIGQLTRASHDFDGRSATERWDAIEAMLRRRGLVRSG
jgi:hypothetical protein